MQTALPILCHSILQERDSQIFLKFGKNISQELSKKLSRIVGLFYRIRHHFDLWILFNFSLHAILLSLTLRQNHLTRNLTVNK